MLAILVINHMASMRYYFYVKLLQFSIIVVFPAVNQFTTITSGNYFRGGSL